MMNLKSVVVHSLMNPWHRQQQPFFVSRQQKFHLADKKIVGLSSVATNDIHGCHRLRYTHELPPCKSVSVAHDRKYSSVALQNICFCYCITSHCSKIISQQNQPTFCCLIFAVYKQLRVQFFEQSQGNIVVVRKYPCVIRTSHPRFVENKHPLSMFIIRRDNLILCWQWA